MKTKLLILSCLLVCSSFFYQADARRIIFTNIQFTYSGPTYFPDINSIENVTFTFDGSDWSNHYGSCYGHVLLSKTSDFNLGDQNKNFYAAKNLSRCFKLVEEERFNGYGAHKVTFPESRPGSGDYNSMLHDFNSEIPDGEYYVAIVFATSYKKIQQPDGTISSGSAYIVIREKNNKKIYIGKKPAPPVQTCDVEVTKFEINSTEVTNYTMLGGSVTVKLSGINSVDAYVTARLLTSGGAASELLLGTNPRVKLTQGTQNLSLLMQPCIPSWDKESYKYIEVKIDANYTETNYNNNSKKISAPKIIKTQSYSALRSLDNTDNNDQTNISELCAIWNNPEQSAVKVSLDEKYIGKEIYIVNVTRNAFVAKQKITATELSVSVANAVRKGDLISIYVDGTEQASKLLKTN